MYLDFGGIILPIGISPLHAVVCSICKQIALQEIRKNPDEGPSQTAPPETVMPEEPNGMTV